MSLGPSSERAVEVVALSFDDFLVAFGISDVGAVLAIYARENGQGMKFVGDVEAPSGAPRADKSGVEDKAGSNGSVSAPASKHRKRPHLKLVQ